MALHILKCKCGKYQLTEKCDCGSTAKSPRPPKYSPDDKYGHYRREVKADKLIEKGLI